jgi:hypothetical protein
MLLFRSEEHLDHWTASRGVVRGAVLSPEQIWGLGRAWYADRLSETWRRKSLDEAEAVFAGLGLSGAFWRLRP